MSTCPDPEAAAPAADEDSLRLCLTNALAAARTRTDAIFACVRPESFFARPIAERHRLIFYLGHVEVFDWNLLARECLRRPPLHAEWERLFAFGIDPVDGVLPQDGPESWPGVDAVRGYGRELRAELDALLAEAPLRGWLANGWAWRMAIEHRAMHAETLSYLLAQLPAAAKMPGAAAPVAGKPAPARERVRIPAGTATLGRDPRDAHTGWDNEYARHRVDVPAFTIDRFPVTNGEWLEFVDAGGYREPKWWRAEDWRWRQQQGLERPVFWDGVPGALVQRTMFGSVPLPLAWPVYVSHAEASAFAAWRGRRLPTEAQWHRAALGTPEGRERAYAWGDESPVPGVHGNFGFAGFDPARVDAHPRGRSAFGVEGLCGNGWQWTRSVFAPFAGFAPLPFYRGYSADFFDGRHFVMKGGSPVTEAAFLRASFRNWFQPHYPYVFAAFRCVDED